MEPDRREADIALEREKKRLEKEKQARAQQLELEKKREREKQERLEEEREKKERDKKEREKDRLKQEARDKAEKEKEKEKAEREKAKQQQAAEDKKKQQAEDAKRKAAAAAADADLASPERGRGIVTGPGGTEPPEPTAGAAGCGSAPCRTIVGRSLSRRGEPAERGSNGGSFGAVVVRGRSGPVLGRGGRSDRDGAKGSGRAAASGGGATGS